MTKCSRGGIWREELRNGLQLAGDDIIRGGLDIVTDKTKNKPKTEQETAQPTAARFKKLKADLEPRPPTAARLTMACTTRNTVNRLARNELNLSPVGI